MKQNNIKVKIKELLKDYGVLNINNEPDLLLLDYLTDSLQMIEFLCNIEEIFEIEIPDDLITYDIFYSLNGLCELIENIIEHGKEEKFNDEKEKIIQK